MKTITILCLHLGYGGIEKYISSLCEMLKDDFKIKIISTYKIYDEPVFYIDKKIDIEYLIECKPCKEEMYESLKNKQIFSFINYGIKNAKLLYLKNKLNIEAIKKIDSDFIITTRDFHNHLVSKYANNNITKIATEHNHHNNNEKYINNLIKSIKGFDYFVLVSKELQNFYKNKVENTKCLYIPNVIEKINDEPLNNYNHNLISIGRLSKEKGFDDLINLIYEIKKDINDIHLDLIGDGVEYNSQRQDVKEKRLTTLNKNKINVPFGFLREHSSKADGYDPVTNINRTGLDEYLKVIFPNINDWVHDKVFGEFNGVKYNIRPDYRSES